MLPDFINNGDCLDETLANSNEFDHAFDNEVEQTTNVQEKVLEPEEPEITIPSMDSNMEEQVITQTNSEIPELTNNDQIKNEETTIPDLNQNITETNNETQMINDTIEQLETQNNDETLEPAPSEETTVPNLDQNINDIGNETQQVNDESEQPEMQNKNNDVWEFSNNQNGYNEGVPELFNNYEPDNNESEISHWEKLENTTTEESSNLYNNSTDEDIWKF